MKDGHTIHGDPAEHNGGWDGTDREGGGRNGVPDGAGGGREREAAIDWEALEREVFHAADMRERSYDRERAAVYRREADRIVSLILYSDMPRVDIEIAVRAFRRRVLAVFPEKEELFTALYLGRFRRIWRQFRQEGGELLAGEP